LRECGFLRLLQRMTVHSKAVLLSITGLKLNLVCKRRPNNIPNNNKAVVTINVLQ